MQTDDVFLQCSVSAQWTNSEGTTVKKWAHKDATLRLVRDQCRSIFLELSCLSVKLAPTKFQLKALAVHKKFMHEGKASIAFQDDKCTVYINNAPPAQLSLFLRTMFVKMSSGTQMEKNDLNRSLRSQLLSSKTSLKNNFEDISPVTDSELQLARNRVTGSRATATTPSPRSRKAAAKTAVLLQPLIDEQQAVLQTCLRGKSLFFTGSAGTGKSYLLKRIIAALPPDVTVATASTGVAACHIGGITLHQFAGIGDGLASLSKCVQLVKSRPHVCSLWRKCKHLIIDEVSMVEGEFFAKLEQMARLLRPNFAHLPFGGIQVILCGDFFQLPPVPITKDSSTDASKKCRKFCFETEAWRSTIQSNVYQLKVVHRQKESEFVDMLNSIRLGQVNEQIVTKLSATSRQIIERDGITATRLCSHTNEAQAINENRLLALPDNERTYTFVAEDTPPNMLSNKMVASQLDRQIPVPKKLVLKVGAQVMLLKNLHMGSGLVNGARGVVVAFEEHGKDYCPVVRFCGGREHVIRPERWAIKTLSGSAANGLMTLHRKQIPLQLAWAFSIHKAQGLTLDCVEMALGRVFEAGQAYVALSRAQSLKTLRVLDFRQEQVWANPIVLKFHKAMHFLQLCLEPTAIPKISVTAGKKRLLVNESKENGSDEVAKKIVRRRLDDVQPLKSINSRNTEITL